MPYLTVYRADRFLPGQFKWPFPPLFYIGIKQSETAVFMNDVKTQELVNLDFSKYFQELIKRMP